MQIMCHASERTRIKGLEKDVGSTQECKTNNKHAKRTQIFYRNIFQQNDSRVFLKMREPKQQNATTSFYNINIVYAKDAPCFPMQQ